MAGSKNNPNARKANVTKLFKGKEVKPVQYIGPYGKYIAAQYEDGELIIDENTSKPLPYRKLVA